MADYNLLDHVADIVSAHVNNNSVAIADVPVLISSVYASLSSLGQAAAPVEEPRTPAVSVRASVKPDALTCLDCGARMKTLKRHVMTDHGLTPAQYRERWNLPASYPMVAADYSARRKELAMNMGLGRKPGQAVKIAAKGDTEAKRAAPAPVIAPEAAPAPDEA